MTNEVCVMFKGVQRWNIELGLRIYYLHSTQNSSFQRRSFQPIFWLTIEKIKLETTKTNENVGQCPM